MPKRDTTLGNLFKVTMLLNKLVQTCNRNKYSKAFSYFWISNFFACILHVGWLAFWQRAFVLSPSLYIVLKGSCSIYVVQDKDTDREIKDQVGLAVSRKGLDRSFLGQHVFTSSKSIVTTKAALVTIYGLLYHNQIETVLLAIITKLISCPFNIIMLL